MFIEKLVLQNTICNSQNLKVVNKFKTKASKPNSINVIVELDPKTRSELEGRDVLYVGWRTCTFGDHINIIQCFKCWRFGHMAKDCKKEEQICADCGGKHKSCKSEVKSCVNCRFAAEVLKIQSVKYDHAAYDRKCIVYKRIYDQLLNRVGRLSGDPEPAL